MLCGLSLLLPRVAVSGPFTVSMLLSEETAPYREFSQRFRGVLQSQPAEVKVAVAARGELAPLNPADLIVSVGLRATELALQMQGTGPVLATLLPRAGYAILRKNSASQRPFTAIFLDQPHARRLALLAQALPDRRRLGVLLGPDSAGDIRALQAAARESGFAVVHERIEQAEELLPALRRILAEADVLYALPDSLVFNHNTAQSILLTSYRANVPVLAYSKAYVDAGALLAVYSTPAQIGQQAAEIVAAMANGAALPPPQHPRYFSVAVNPHVARSLGLAIETESALLEKLKRIEVRE